MPQDWFFTRNGGERGGPVPTEGIQQMIAMGQLGPDDMVWTAGMAAWDAARNVPLFYAQPTAQDWYGQGQQQQQQGGWPQQQPYGLQYGGYGGYRPEYAGFWLRVVAAIVDTIVLWIIGLPVALMTGNAPWQDQPAHPDLTMLGLNMAFSVILQWLYDAFQESSSYQATLGKRLVGIKVTNGQGQPIGFGRASGRHFAKIISGLICGIGYLMAGFTDRKQALHDTMADTLVVKA